MAVTQQTSPAHSDDQCSSETVGDQPSSGFEDNTPDIDRQSTRSFAQATVPDIVTTAIGGNEMSGAIAKSEAHLGYESNQTRPPGKYTIDFVDFPFTDEDATYEEHLEAVQQEVPKYAVAPDVEDRDLETVIEMADELRQYVTEAVIVVPKETHPREIPDRFRVGVPLANFGSDAPWQWDDYAEATELHLLGGAPQKQLSFAKRVGNVKSIDGATFVKSASFGDVWCPHKSRYWHETGGEQMDYYERISASIHNINEAWRVDIHNKTADYQLPIDPDRYEKRQREIEQAEEKISQKREEEMAKAERRTEEKERTEEINKSYRQHGARGADPYIHPDDADCLHPRERREMDVVDFEQRVSEFEQRVTERSEQRVENFASQLKQRIRSNRTQQSNLQKFASA